MSSLPLPNLPISPQRDEADWARRIREGDSVAFERAFKAYFAELAGYAYRFVRAEDAAADIVQSVFAALWAQHDRLMVTESLAQYLYGAVRYRALNYLRREGVARRWLDGATADKREHPSWLRNDGETAVADADLAAAIRRAVAALPDRVREVALLRWQRQLSYAEIAEALGLSVKTVEVYVARAAQALRASQALLLQLRP